MAGNDTTTMDAPERENEIELLIEQGWANFNKEHYDNALATFRQVINKVPITNENKILALEGAGATLRRLRRFVEAEDTFAEAVKLNGKTATIGTLIERGWLNFFEQNYECARADFQQVLDQPTIDEQVRQRAMIGRIAVLQIEDADDNQSRSAELLATWLKSKPPLPEKEAANILYLAAKTHSGLNNYPPALIAIDLALERDPANEDYLAFKIDTLKWMRCFAEAEALYIKAQQKLPNSLKLRFEIGHTYYEQERFKEALTHFDVEALKRLISDKTKEDFTDELQKTQEWTIVVLRKMYELEKAEKKVDEALACFPDNANLLSEKAVIYFSKQEYEKAIKIFDRVLKIDEYNEFAHRWRAASFRKLGKYDEAKKRINEALEKFPIGSWLWEEQAWLYFDQNDLKKADDCFAEAIKLDAYLPRLQFSRVEVLSRLSLNDDALQIFLKLRKQFPRDLEVAEQLGWFYLRRNELDHAWNEFEFINTEAPGSALAENGMGGYFIECRNYSAAADAFRRAIEAVDYEPQYHINLAWALVRQVKGPAEGQKSECRKELLDEAETHCRKALERDAYNATAFSCLGVIAFRRNRLLDAEGYFLKSLELHPQHDSRVELGALYVQMGRYEDAKKQLSEAIRVNRNDARAHIELGNVFLLTENHQEAIRECRQAVSIEPNNDEAHRALAIAFMRAGHYEEAEAVVRKALNHIRTTEKWKFHLLLSQVLIRLGDDNNKDRDLYDEALKHVNAANRLKPPSGADIYFHAGIVHYKLEDYRSAHRNFKSCIEMNGERFEAERYAQLVKNMIREQRRVLRVNTWAGWSLAALCFVMIVALTTLYYKGATRPVPHSEVSAVNNENRQRVAGAQLEKIGLGGQPEVKEKTEVIVDKSMLTFMTPLLLGLLVVALLLPNLNKLKLPGGFEAEISEVKTQQTISTGPKGEIGFGSSVPIISPGPGSR